MSNAVRWGIIGASPGKGWASASHVPAALALDEIELLAIATSSSVSAQAAQEVWNVPKAYDDPHDLISDPEIEAVTIAVNLPSHLALVEAALDAGKHVYCEWPLTPDTASATRLADRARCARLESVVGLQAARSAVIDRAAEIVSAGDLGELISATAEIMVPFQGDTISAEHTYLLDAAQGANLLTISTIHALDTLCRIAGEVVDVSATLAVRYSDVTIVETGERIKNNSPDQVSITGTLVNGAVLTATAQAGVKYEPGVRLVVRGKAGALVVTARPTLTLARLTLERVDAMPGSYNYTSYGEVSARKEIRVASDPSLRAVPPGPPTFVGRLYLDLAGAIRRGKREGPDFSHAVRRHQLIDAIVAASRTGVRQTIEC